MTPQGRTNSVQVAEIIDLLDKCQETQVTKTARIPLPSRPRLGTPRRHVPPPRNLALEVRQLREIGRRTHQLAIEAAQRRVAADRVRELRDSNATTTVVRGAHRRVERCLTPLAECRSVPWAIYTSAVVLACLGPMVLLTSVSIWPVAGIAAIFPLLVLAIGRIATSRAVAREEAWLASLPLRVSGYWSELGRRGGGRRAMIRFRGRVPLDGELACLRGWAVEGRPSSRTVIVSRREAMSPAAFRRAARSLLRDCARKLHPAFPIDTVLLG